MVSGIGLFTQYKYQKSLESTVPLDAHGNPISEPTPDLVAVLEREADAERQPFAHGDFDGAEADAEVSLHMIVPEANTNLSS